MVIRRLRRDEVELFWTIDRREIHENIYRVQEGKLILTPYYFDIPGWRTECRDEETAALYKHFDQGSVFLGMFDAETLVGIAVVGKMPHDDTGDTIQLEKLFVSRDYRGKGIGKRLFEAAQEIARDWGANFLYISATPTENTVNFYLRRGSHLAIPPDPELLALEPKDVHLVCPVDFV